MRVSEEDDLNPSVESWKRVENWKKMNQAVVEFLHKQIDVCDLWAQQYFPCIKVSSQDGQ